MAQNIDALVEQFNKLSSDVQGGNLENAHKLLESLKLPVASLPYPSANVSVDEMKRRLMLGRNVLEQGALLSIKRKDVPAFERFYTQLKTYYYDFGKRYSLPASSVQYQIFGLNLLRLLADHKLDEFHTEVELIPLDKHHDIFVRQPLQLEQYMMEGAYNKVLKARSEVPSDTFNIFMDKLMTTVRADIADCIEKSYETLKTPDAARLLGFTTEQDLSKFSAERNWRTVQTPNGIVFNFKVENQQTSQLPSHRRVIQQTLHYAKELERIV